MSAERGSPFIESVVAKTTFTRGFLANPTGPIAREQYDKLYTDVAKAAGCGTRGQFNSEYVERRYADMAYDSLVPHELNPFLRDLFIATPVIAGYELRTMGAIIVVAPDMTSAIFSHCQIPIPNGGQEHALSWITTEMRYGVFLYQNTHRLLPSDPSLDIYRDFVNSLNTEDL